jgi:CarD family transcriptional regulator
MPVKKIKKSRKTKVLTSAAKPRQGGTKTAKRRVPPKAKKARTASMPRTGRSSAKGSTKAARKPAAANSRSGGKTAARAAATLARLKKAGAGRAAKGRTASELAKAKHLRGKPASVSKPKLRKNMTTGQPAARGETQKVLSERRAHAEAVLALRATASKLAPKGRESAGAPLKVQKKPSSPAPVRPSAPPAPAQRPFDSRGGFPERPGFRPAPKPPGAVKLGFKPAEFIVYPAHGVGQILAIEEQEVAGFKLELFVISFAKDKMILKVPTPKTVSVGMRKLAGAEVVKQALTTLTGRARIKRTMWSRRAQEYEAKINSGDLVAIAEVVRDLYRSEAQPEQSYSERQLYEAALDRVAREIAVVQKLTETESLKLIESQLQKGPRRSKADEAEAAAGESEDGVDEAA